MSQKNTSHSKQSAALASSLNASPPTFASSLYPGLGLPRQGNTHSRSDTPNSHTTASSIASSSMAQKSRLRHGTVPGSSESIQARRAASLSLALGLGDGYTPLSPSSMGASPILGGNQESVGSSLGLEFTASPVMAHNEFPQYNYPTSPNLMTSTASINVLDDYRKNFSHLSLRALSTQRMASLSRSKSRSRRYFSVSRDRGSMEEDVNEFGLVGKAPSRVPSGPGSRVHSRRNSLFLSTGINGMSPVIRSAEFDGEHGGSSSASSNYNGTGSNKAPLSRLPSFLNGIEHHTRVTTGRRGFSRSLSRSVSRSGSRDHSRSGSKERETDEGTLLEMNRKRTSFYTPRDKAVMDDEESDQDRTFQESNRRKASAAERLSEALFLPTFSVPPTKQKSESPASPSPISGLSSRKSSSSPLGLGFGTPNRGQHARFDPPILTSTPNKSPSMSHRSTLGASPKPRYSIGPETLDEQDEEEPLSSAPTARSSSRKPGRIMSFSNIAEIGIGVSWADMSDDEDDADQEDDNDDEGYIEESLSGIDVFTEGERVGVGVYLDDRGGWVRDVFGMDDGFDLMNPEDDDEDLKRKHLAPGTGLGSSSALEVVKRLGEGTYAIVYLVREVLFDLTNDSPPLSPINELSFDLINSGGYKRTLSWASDSNFPEIRSTYGKEFALKCLCKKNLSEEQIEVQRGEAVLHRSLPEHECIVRLYGAFETDDWLFLVLEYCPGQDLYYWLDERADNSAELYDLHSRASSPFEKGSVLPPSPPRDKETDLDEEILSKTITAQPMLLRPNQFTSPISHTPAEPSILSSTSLFSPGRLRLISRMFAQMCSAVQACHDRGISHRDIKPENFIVMDGRHSNGKGSNRGKARVLVKITDWGLGTDQTDCQDFDCGSRPYMAYECRNNLAPSYDPRPADVWSLGIVFLNLVFHRSPWSDPSRDDPDFNAYAVDSKTFFQSRFIGIGEEVAEYLSEKVFVDVASFNHDGTMKYRATAGEFGEWASRLVEMIGPHKKDKPSATSELTFQLPATTVRPSQLYVPRPSLLSQLAPMNGDNEDNAESPVRSMSTTYVSVKPIPRISEDDDELPSPTFPSSRPLQAVEEDQPFVLDRTFDEQEIDDSTLIMHKNIEESGDIEPIEIKDSSESTEALKPIETDPDGEQTSREPGSPNGEAVEGQPRDKSKRRKRGARKSKSRPNGGSEYSATSLDGLSNVAAISEDISRTSSRQTNRTRDEEYVQKKSRPGMFGRMKGLMMDGNQDLNALKYKVHERNAELGLSSAPAKIQSHGSTSRHSVDSRDSRGTVSYNGEGKQKWETSSDHWASSSQRRERQQRRRAEGSLTATSSSSSVPLSMFSSTKPSELSQNWRQGSSSRRWGSSSSTDATTIESRPPRPQVNVSIDTADLGQIASPLTSPAAEIVQPILPAAPPAEPKEPRRLLGSKKSFKILIENDTPSNGNIVNKEPPKQQGKLSRMLNVFK